ncbi:uncharacterized protein SCHCODRAFT_01080870 [Schizophyllum commune H4-8]|nr:uncharacterized protein SCHCODRAFT_01080870 [Schizophyllum commune H4-8]KAI5893331.1 hypothetical protein SCHCODRAFT_01080870 [Schizophyllum commune H4-8]
MRMTDYLKQDISGALGARGSSRRRSSRLRDEICDEGFRTPFRRGRTAGGESKVPRSASTREKGTFRWDRAAGGTRGRLSAQCEEGGGWGTVPPPSFFNARALPSALVTAGRRRSIRAFAVKKAMGEGTSSFLPREGSCHTMSASPLLPTSFPSLPPSPILLLSSFRPPSTLPLPLLFPLALIDTLPFDIPSLPLPFTTRATLNTILKPGKPSGRDGNNRVDALSAFVLREGGGGGGGGERALRSSRAKEGIAGGYS